MLNIQSICIFFDEKPRSQRKDEGKTFPLVFHQVRNFIKKETLAQVFSCKFWKIFKSIFSSEHRWANASEFIFLWWYLKDFSN